MRRETFGRESGGGRETRAERAVLLNQPTRIALTSEAFSCTVRYNPEHATSVLDPDAVDLHCGARGDDRRE